MYTDHCGLEVLAVEVQCSSSLTWVSSGRIYTFATTGKRLAL